MTDGVNARGMTGGKKDRSDAACMACEAYKVYWFTVAAEYGIDQDVARALMGSIGTAWMTGYLYAMNHGDTSKNK